MGFRIGVYGGVGVCGYVNRYWRVCLDTNQMYVCECACIWVCMYICI